MTEQNPTEGLLFPELVDQPVVAKFDPRQGRSDGGAIVLGAADRRLRRTAALAASLEDAREPGKVQHELVELLTQRVLALALPVWGSLSSSRLAPGRAQRLSAATRGPRKRRARPPPDRRVGGRGPAAPGNSPRSPKSHGG